MFRRIIIIKPERSRSARRLRRSLAQVAGIPVRCRTSTERFLPSTFYINWGVSRGVPRLPNTTNASDSVLSAVEKRRSLAVMAEMGVPALEFTENRYVAEQWLEEDGKLIVRHNTRGHSGQGLQVVEAGQGVPDAPLYTRRFPTGAEYRVHVAFGDVLLINQKRRRTDHPPNDEERQVRTYGNGWVFVSNNLRCDREGQAYRHSLSELAVGAVSALGLQHGAVDIVVNHRRLAAGRPDAMQVVEVNTAPSLEAPSTINVYTSAFMQRLLEEWT